MAAIFQTTYSNYFFLYENWDIPIKISLKFVPNGSIDNKPALVQIMAWRWTGHKPLCEPILDMFTNIYVSLGLGELILLPHMHFLWE